MWIITLAHVPDYSRFHIKSEPTSCEIWNKNGMLQAGKNACEWRRILQSFSTMIYGRVRPVIALWCPNRLCMHDVVLRAQGNLCSQKVRQTWCRSFRDKSRPPRQVYMCWLIGLIEFNVLFWITCMSCRDEVHLYTNFKCNAWLRVWLLGYVCLFTCFLACLPAWLVDWLSDWLFD